MCKTVVIVDDSEFIIDLLVRFFTQQMHFKVVGTGTDGNAAVELFRKHKPDLLSLDLRMPGKDSLEIIREILGEFPGAKILIVTALHGEPLIECAQLGVKNFINKPLYFHNPAFILEFEDVVKNIFIDSE